MKKMLNSFLVFTYFISSLLTNTTSTYAKKPTQLQENILKVPFINQVTIQKALVSRAPKQWSNYSVEKKGNVDAGVFYWHLCGPSSTAMALTYLGLYPNTSPAHVDTTEAIAIEIMKNLTMRWVPIYDRSTKKITKNYGFAHVDALTEYHKNDDYPNAPSLESFLEEKNIKYQYKPDLVFDDIVKSIDANKPIIARVNTSSGGHILVIIGYKKNPNKIIVHDPYGNNITPGGKWRNNNDNKEGKVYGEGVEYEFVDFKNVFGGKLFYFTDVPSSNSINLPAYEIDTNKIYTFTASHSNQALTVTNTGVVQSTLLPNIPPIFLIQKSQQFRFTPLSGKDAGYYKITPAENNYMCLDVNQESKEPGAKIIMYQCKDSENQKWKLYSSNGLMVIQSKHSNLVLDVAGSSMSNNAPVIQYAFSDQPNQKWKISEIAPAPTKTSIPTKTSTPTITPTKTSTKMPTITSTITATPSKTATATPKNTLPPTATVATATPSYTPSPAPSNTVSPTTTNSLTPTNTATPTPKLYDMGRIYWDIIYNGLFNSQRSESWYFQLTAERGFVIKVTAPDSSSFSVNLYDPNWAPLASTTSVNGYAELASIQPQNYPYYVAVQGLGGSSGNYSLQIVCQSNCASATATSTVTVTPTFTPTVTVTATPTNTNTPTPTNTPVPINLLKNPGFEEGGLRDYLNWNWNPYNGVCSRATYQDIPWFPPFDGLRFLATGKSSDYPNCSSVYQDVFITPGTDTKFTFGVWLRSGHGPQNPLVIALWGIKSGYSTNSNKSVSGLDEQWVCHQVTYTVQVPDLQRLRAEVYLPNMNQDVHLDGVVLYSGDVKYCP